MKEDSGYVLKQPYIDLNIAGSFLNVVSFLFCEFSAAYALH